LQFVVAMSYSSLSDRIAQDGLECVDDADLVALVVADDTRTPGLGRSEGLRWLDSHGGFGGLARSSPFALVDEGRMSARDAFRLSAAIEIGRRVALERARMEPMSAFPESRAVFDWAGPRLVGLEHEELWLLALDGKNQLRASKRVAQGGLHGLHVATRDPLRFALREAASAFILVHNHPSGDPTPSEEDMVFTHRIAVAGRVVGAPLLDHVIVAREGFTSFVEAGFLTADGVTGIRAVESRVLRRVSRAQRGTRRSLR